MGMGLIVRVDKRVEELVKKVSRLSGFSRYRVRTTAILYGLLSISYGMAIARSRRDLAKLIEDVKDAIEDVAPLKVTKTRRRKARLEALASGSGQVEK